MYAVIRRYQATQLGSLEESTRQVQEQFLPLVSKLEGFVAYYVVNSGPTEIVTISIFESQAGAEESVRQAALWVKQNPTMARLLSNPPDIIKGEVTLHQGT